MIIVVVLIVIYIEVPKGLDNCSVAVVTVKIDIILPPREGRAVFISACVSRRIAADKIALLGFGSRCFV